MHAALTPALSQREREITGGRDSFAIGASEARRKPQFVLSNNTEPFWQGRLKLLPLVPAAHGLPTAIRATR